MMAGPIDRLKLAGLPVLLAVSGAAAAQDTPAAPAAQSAAADARFDRFAPKSDTTATHIDYSLWDEALSFFVFRMGKSIRDSASAPAPSVGTRRVYGHDSRYRLEGNRVVFSYLTDEIVQSLTDYRKDLEATADKVDIPSLSRNEQLAYWINLHNVAVIEQIARDYPVSQPRQIKVGDSDLPPDEAPFITVNGVAMSPRDIRTRIVFAHWHDPKVIYGFFRGEIGGPSIQPEAFTAENVGALLDRSAGEFVNSLRGTQSVGDTLKVSEIYAEARPFLFPDWPADLRAHLRGYADAKVTKIIDGTSDVDADIYEADIADLSKGERDPNYGYVTTGDEVRGTRVPLAIARLLSEQAQKIQKMMRQDDYKPTVTIIPFVEPGEDEKDGEVK